MAIDVDLVRRQTPACENIIHLNNAGCSLMPQSVRQVLLDYLEQEQTIGGYETEKLNKQALEDFYPTAAMLINADPSEIAFCESATRGWQQFFYSIHFNSGDRIITSRMDYGSNVVAYIQVARERGAEVRFIDTDESGDLDLDHLNSLIDARTRLISISHIPTGCGIINDAEKIGEIAAQAGIPFLLDTCQSVGQVQVDVKRLRCTALATTARKYLRGPRGTGFMYVARDYLESASPAYLEQQGVNLINEREYRLLESARRFENFECHYAGKLALKHAMEYAMEIGLENIENRIIALADQCRRELTAIPGVVVHDRGVRQGGIVTFSVEGLTPDQIREKLWLAGINVWVSTGPGSLLDFQSRGIEAVARASVHYYNSESEIQTFCDAVAALI